MALSEAAGVEIQVLEDGHLQVRRVTNVLRDGVEIARAFHRVALAPGSDVAGQDARVRAVANAVWTPEVIAAYQARRAALDVGQ